MINFGFCSLTCIVGSIVTEVLSIIHHCDWNGFGWVQVDLPCGITLTNRWDWNRRGAVGGFFAFLQRTWWSVKLPITFAFHWKMTKDKSIVQEMVEIFSDAFKYNLKESSYLRWKFQQCPREHGPLPCKPNKPSGTPGSSPCYPWMAPGQKLKLSCAITPSKIYGFDQYSQGITFCYLYPE